MSSAVADTILSDLAQVDAQRALRAADAALAAKVHALKLYQQRRFEKTYPDLLADPRHAKASLFFLNELYGPTDFSQRDAQFARIVPALVRLFPKDVAHTVQALTALHALSERLDTAMAQQIDRAEWNAAAYLRAWQAVGEPGSRAQQIELILDVGRALDVYTRSPMLRHTLRLMRAPAKAAGLFSLQQFLEGGFDTFRAMRGADLFLQTVDERERSMAALLFAGGSAALVQLP
jgi:hypothetical protein